MAIKRLLILINTTILFYCSASVFSQTSERYKLNENGYWQSDNLDGTYTNPIIHSDYSDPDIIRVGDDFYLTASSFNCIPGLPILHSKDLVNWEHLGYALAKQPPFDVFDKVQNGKGVWAPSIRHHNGEFYIFWGDPDFGIYVVKSKNPEGLWSNPHLVHSAKGWIDPCPFWDEDGKAYLVHAYAGSRSGFKNILVINEMSPDGLSLNEKCTLVFDGNKNHPTTEGPKLYKRNGWYYIFAPSGGVKQGWQLVLRSKNIYGPYEEKIVLHQGKTDINGPHQGGLVELNSGESWFLHFQDKDAYGRILHLQPVNWILDWPLVGIDQNNDGIGEPVITHKKPRVKDHNNIYTLSISDEFNSVNLGYQWQWNANFKSEWALTSPYGFLRLNCILAPNDSINFWGIPNLLLQKIPAEEFTAEACIKFYPKQDGDRTGMIIMGEDYAYVEIKKSNSKNYLTFNTAFNSSTEIKKLSGEKKEIFTSEIYLKLEMKRGGICQFYYSEDSNNFYKIGELFTAKAGRWIGSKIGVFALKDINSNDSGYADIDWFRVK